MKDNNNIYDESIKRVITVYVPGTVCNLRCSYCYVSECLKVEHKNDSQFQYSIEHMVEAFRPERIGGRAHITVIGEGETLIPKEVVPFVKGLLHLGHVVEVVTNNTLNQRIDELLDTPKEDIGRLIVKCSLHWKELKRINKVDDYFNNIRRIIAAGASSYPFLVICDEYMACLDEICEVCMREIGALPQCTPCVTAESREDFLRGGNAVTSPECTPEFVKMINQKFHSKLFLESVRFLNIDVKRIFCYAGKWSFGVNMGNGTMCKCHNALVPGNFFENLSEPYENEPIGCECGVVSCCLQYGFYGMGLIPEIENVPTYTGLVCDREKLFQDEVKELMDVKIADSEKILSDLQKIEFLMQRVQEKDRCIQMQNEALGKYRVLIRAYREQYEPSEQLMVTYILDVIDGTKMDLEHINRITYSHIKALQSICEKLEDGMSMYHELLRKLYQVIIQEKMYKETFLCCDLAEEMNYIATMPITVFVVEGRNIEEVETCLAEQNIERFLAVFFEQFEQIFEKNG